MIRLLASDAELAALEPEWSALWARSDATPFQSPAWLLPWWGVFGTGQPRVATLRAPDGRLAGVLPLYVLPTEGKLLPIGAGVSDCLDVLLAPGLPADSSASLLAAALAHTALPCHLIELPPGSPLRTAALPAGWTGDATPGEVCPTLPLGPDLRATIPARQHRKLRMARHRAAEIGGFIIEERDPASTFAHLTRLHGARWRARGEAGVLDGPAVQALHAAALPSLARAGLLRLQAVRLAGEVAAVAYAMLDRHRLHLYLSGFDEARTRESPGTLLLGSMLEQAIREGRREAHFLRGDEAYKFAWGAQPTRNATRLLMPG